MYGLNDCSAYCNIDTSETVEPEAEGITEATKLAMKRIIEQRPFWNPPDPAPWVTLSPLMTGTRVRCSSCSNSASLLTCTDRP